MKILRKIVLFHFLLLSALFSHSQTGTGYYLLDNTRTPIKFIKTFSKTEDAFITTYKIYDVTGKKLKFTVIANHSQIMHLVIVTVANEAIIDNDPEVNRSSIYYENASMEPFGLSHLFYKGFFDAKVKFTTTKFEYVKVMQVRGDLIKKEFLFLDN